MQMNAAPALINTPVLETERLILRAPQASDFAPYADFIASDRGRYMGGPMPRDLAWRAFASGFGHWVIRGFGGFVVTLKSTGAAIGRVGPWFPESWPEPEIGWGLWDHSAEGKGYAFEAAAAALRHAFRDLGWKTAVSYIVPENARSIALAKRLGAVQDEAAAYPGDKPALVFRHPNPGAA